MEPGKIIFKEYIVQYYEPGRTEGGPELQKRYDFQVRAEREFNRLEKDSDVAWVQLWEQTSVITRTRIK